jgi:hypothetical protein
MREEQGGAPGRPDESEHERLDRNMGELLGELRVALPGVQVLFGFLLTVPFANGFQKVTDFQRDVYFVTLLCAGAASALLIATSAYHRIVFRRGQKRHLVLLANRFTIAGLAFLALAMTGAVLLTLPIALVYMWTKPAHEYDPSVMHSSIIPAPTIAGILIVIGGATHNTSLASTIGMGSVPVVSAIQGQPASFVAMSAAIFAILMIRRLEGVGTVVRGGISPARAILYRTVFDSSGPPVRPVGHMDEEPHPRPE